MELDSFTFVLLRRPADAPDLAEDELDRLQQQHLRFLDSMAERGVMLFAGPFSEQPDESWRGLCLYVTPLDETRALAAEDPLVKAGRLAADAFTFWTKKGVLGPARTLG